MTGLHRRDCGTVGLAGPHAPRSPLIMACVSQGLLSRPLLFPPGCHHRFTIGPSNSSLHSPSEGRTSVTRIQPHLANHPSQRRTPLAPLPVLEPLRWPKPHRSADETGVLAPAGPIRHAPDHAGTCAESPIKRPAFSGLGGKPHGRSRTGTNGRWAQPHLASSPAGYFGRWRWSFVTPPVFGWRVSSPVSPRARRATLPIHTRQAQSRSSPCLTGVVASPRKGSSSGGAGGG